MEDITPYERYEEHHRANEERDTEELEPAPQDEDLYDFTRIVRRMDTDELIAATGELSANDKKKLWTAIQEHLAE